MTGQPVEAPCGDRYGMPREAALLGAAQHVLPLPDIGSGGEQGRARRE